MYAKTGISTDSARKKKANRLRPAGSPNLAGSWLFQAEADAGVDGSASKSTLHYRVLARKLPP